MAEDPTAASGSGGCTIEECQAMIKRSLQTPMVKSFKNQMEKAGCVVGDKFIKAVNCNQNIGGGYTQGEGIIVCSNELDMQNDVNRVILHELIHAYDDCRSANLEWSNCAHHACSEIRANRLSGDCNFKQELLRGNLNIKAQEKECIKRRVMKSLINNPYCSQAAAKNAMKAVWDVCYNDTQPFDKAP